jgi:hypothetical protein
MAERKKNNRRNRKSEESIANSRSQFPDLEDIHSLLARMGSKRGFKQWENSTGASSDELPALGGDSLDWDEMPQVGSSFHRSLIGNRIEDWEMENLDTLIGSESDDSFFPLDGEIQDGSDDDQDGSVHYY